MPNPKSGTITFDMDRAVREVKAGRVEFKVDKGAIIHVAFGRASFEPQLLIENLASLWTPSAGQAQRCQGAVFQEPDGRLRHGPRHPRGCPGRAVEGSRLRAARRAPIHPPVTPAATIHRTFRHRQRCVRGSGKGHEPVRRTGPKSSTGPGSPGTPTGTPRQEDDRASTRVVLRAATEVPARDTQQDRRLHRRPTGKEAPCRPRPSRPRSQS